MEFDVRKYKNEDKEFVYTVKKEAYKNYIEEYFGLWDEKRQMQLFDKFIETAKDNLWIISTTGLDIGFYNGNILDDGFYEIGNICIVSSFRGYGLGTKVLNYFMDQYKENSFRIQFFKNIPVTDFYKKLGFIKVKETPYHFIMEREM